MKYQTEKSDKREGEERGKSHTKYHQNEWWVRTRGRGRERDFPHWIPLKNKEGRSDGKGKRGGPRGRGREREIPHWMPLKEREGRAEEMGVPVSAVPRQWHSAAKTVE